MSVDTDEKIANRYLNTIQSAKSRGIEFSLSLISFINLCNAKKCYFTGLSLEGKNLTLDRVDSTKGYVKGNVVACHKTFNSFKSMIEDKGNPLTLNRAIRGLIITKKRLEE